MEKSKIRKMQNFIEELTSMNISKGEALQLLVRKDFDHETFSITKVAIDKYFESIEDYRCYERSFFMKEVSKQEAIKYFNEGEEVFSLNDDGSESLITSLKDFNNTEIYGIEVNP